MSSKEDKEYKKEMRDRIISLHELQKFRRTGKMLLIVSENHAII